MFLRNRGLRSAVAVAGVLAGALALTGCNRDAAAEPGSEEDKIVIGFSQATMNHPFRVAMVEQNVAYAEEEYDNVEVQVLDAQDDAATQVANMESLIAQQVDAIIISPVTSEALTPVVQEAMDAGIPVITVDRSVETEVTAHIGGDNTAIAENVGEFVIEKTGGEAKIIEIQGTAGASATIERAEGFRAAIADEPGLKIVAETDGNYERNKATAFIENNLSRFQSGEVTVVYAHNDAMAMGAQLALEQAGLADGVMVIGIDGENAAIQAVADGKLTATFTYPFGAPEAMIAAVKAAQGEEIEPQQVLESHQIDESNADDFIGKGF